MLTPKTSEQRIGELTARLRRLDEIDLDLLENWLDKKLAPKEEPWAKHFHRSAWQEPLTIRKIADACHVEPALVRRIFLAGKSPGNWKFQDTATGPQWPTTMMDRWREIVATVDEDELPPDKPLVWEPGQQVFGPKEA